MFDHMVPGPHRPPGGVEPRIRHLQPRRRPVRRTADRAIGLPDGTRGAGPKSQVVGDTGRAGPGDGQRGDRPAAWTRALAADNQAVAQPTAFDLASLGCGVGLPNTQSTVKPSLELLELDFNVTVAGDGPTGARAGDRPRHRPDGLLHGPSAPSIRGWWSTRTIWPPHPSRATTQSSAAGEYSTRDLAATDQLLGSVGYHKDPAGSTSSRRGAADPPDGGRDRATRGSTGWRRDRRPAARRGDQR